MLETRNRRWQDQKNTEGGIEVGLSRSSRTYFCFGYWEEHQVLRRIFWRPSNSRFRTCRCKSRGRFSDFPIVPLFHDKRQYNKQGLCPIFTNWPETYRHWHFSPLLTFLPPFRPPSPPRISLVSGFDYEVKASPYFWKDQVITEEFVDRFLVDGDKWSKQRLNNRGLEWNLQIAI